MSAKRLGSGGAFYGTRPTNDPGRAKKVKRVSKAQALVDYGLADTLAEARAMLKDMGE